MGKSHFFITAALVLCVSAAVFATAAQTDDDDALDLQTFVDQLSPENQQFFASMDFSDEDEKVDEIDIEEENNKTNGTKTPAAAPASPKKKGYVGIVNVVDRLRDRLIKERSSLQTAQRGEHEKLQTTEKNKEKTCRTSGSQKTLLNKAENDEKAAAEKVKTQQREVLVASSIRAKNLQANNQLRRNFEGEEKVLRQLLGMIDNLHKLKGEKVAKQRLIQANEIKGLLELLESPSAEEKAQMSSLDVGRVHTESLTLKSMIEKMIADIKEQATTMVKQETHDGVEVERLSKLVAEAKTVATKATANRQSIQDRYAVLLRHCESASGKYSETAKIVLQHSKEALRRQGVINRELAILGEMREKVISHMDGAQQYKLSQIELKREEARIAAENKKLTEQELKEQEREKATLIRAQQARKDELAKQEAQRKKLAAQSAQALKEAEKKEKEAQIHAQQAEKAALDAANKAKLEKDRQKKRLAEEAAKKAKAAKERLERRRKVAICIDLTRAVTKELMGSASAPNFAINQCTEMGGDAAALRAGLQRLIRGTASFSERRCAHTVSQLFSKLLSRSPSAKEAEAYKKLCVSAGESDKALSKRIKDSKEYKLRVSNPHIARKCLKAVVDTWTQVMESKPSTTNTVYWAKQCVRGMTTTEIAAELRKTAAFKAIAARRAEAARVERLKAEAKKAALIAAKERAERAAAERRRQQQIAVQHEQAEKERLRRAQKHAKISVALQKRAASYKSWFEQWKGLSHKRRANKWQALTDSASKACQTSSKVCGDRSNWLKKFKLARTRAGIYAHRYWKALMLLRRVRSRASSPAAAHSVALQKKYQTELNMLKTVAKRNQQLSLRWRSVLSRLQLRREKVAKECANLAIACRAAIHRYHGILHERVGWMRVRVTVWKQRAHDAAKRARRCTDSHERDHFRLTHLHAKRVAKKMQGHLKVIRTKIQTWRKAQRKKRHSQFRHLIRLWTKNSCCRRDKDKAAAHYSKKFRQAAAIAKRALVSQRINFADSKKTTLSCGARKERYQAAARFLNTYRTAMSLARRFFKLRLKTIRAAKACAHRSSLLMARIRNAALRRARIIAARRLLVLRLARTQYEDAKKNCFDFKKLEIYRRTLDKAHHLAQRAHAALQRASDLAARSALEQERERKQALHFCEEEHTLAALHVEAARREAIHAVHKKRVAIAKHKQELAVHSRILKRARRLRKRRLSFERQRRLRECARRKALQAVSYAIASIAGDPHLHTFDGRSILLSSRGDFVLLRGEDYEVQARVRFANRAAGAGYVIGISTKMPGANGDIVEIARDGVAVNYAVTPMSLGVNPVNGGAVFFGKDEHNLDYIKVSLNNGVFMTLNWGINRRALNVAFAVNANIVSSSTGLLTHYSAFPDRKGSAIDKNRADDYNAYTIPGRSPVSVDIEEQQTQQKMAPHTTASLFAGLAVVDDDEAEMDDDNDSEDSTTTAETRSSSSSSDASSSSERVVEIDAMLSAEELCRNAFSGLDETWHQCPRACVPSRVHLQSGRCLVDTSRLNGLSEPQMRACECLFDVAAAGSSWAQADARGALLVDELKKAVADGKVASAATSGSAASSAPSAVLRQAKKNNVDKKKKKVVVQKPRKVVLKKKAVSKK